MNLLAMSAAVLALLIYIPTTVLVWRGELVLNLATFMLWGLLDAIAAASMFVKGGNWELPAAYVAGVACVLAAMIKARTFTWTWVETVTTVLVAASIIVWMFSGPVMATVVSTSAMLFASMPQIKDTWQKPQESTLWVWVAYLVVNTMSTVAGNDWSISERFYPAACTILTTVMVLLCLRKFRTPVAQ